MIVGNKSDLDGERAVETSLASSKIEELGLTYMQVSAKTGHNIKQFFKQLACVIAGGKKTKQEPVAPTSKPANPAVSNQARAAVNASGNVSLPGALQGKQQRKKKKCEC